MPAYDIDFGSVAVAPYEHTQASPSDVWVIDHFLGRHPVAVQVVDSGGTPVIGDLEFTDLNHATVRFSAAFGGKAYVL